jgi:hypothetical protein
MLPSDSHGTPMNDGYLMYLESQTVHVRTRKRRWTDHPTSYEAQESHLDRTRPGSHLARGWGLVSSYFSIGHGVTQGPTPWTIVRDGKEDHNITSTTWYRIHVQMSCAIDSSWNVLKSMKQGSLFLKNSKFPFFEFVKPKFGSRKTYVD